MSIQFCLLAEPSNARGVSAHCDSQRSGNSILETFNEVDQRQIDRRHMTIADFDVTHSLKFKQLTSTDNDYM